MTAHKALVTAALVKLVCRYILVGNIILLLTWWTIAASSAETMDSSLPVNA
jgi:hypothetical protein